MKARLFMEELPIPLMGIASDGSKKGKTRLILALLDELAHMGLTAAVLKHGQHVQWPIAKDSGLFMQAGATAALIASPSGWQLCAAPIEEVDFTLAIQILKQSCRADLVLVEGYKQGSQPKLLLSEDVLAEQQLLPHTVALVSDTVQHILLPCYNSMDIAGIANFIISYHNIT